MLKKHELSHQVLETAIWIECDGQPIYFYDALDRAYEEGWILPTD